ncbi:MAG: hypothetical protein IID30_11670 [Planctomycetes bacterium]|nr:hypothetical protein [Planctomycetota bacterium]
MKQSPRIICVVLAGLMLLCAGCYSPKTPAELETMYDSEVISEYARVGYEETRIQDWKGFTVETYRNAVRQEMARRYPKWTAEAIEAVLLRKVLIGMNKAQVRASWGRPYRSPDSYESAQGRSETWRYRITEHADNYVEFYNGRVSSITKLRH